MNVGVVAPMVTPLREPALGGAQAVVCDLARALSARGHEVTLYALHGSAVEGVRVVHVDADPAALAADLVRPGQEAAAPSAAMTSLYERLYPDVAAAGHDVVHSHGFDEPAIEVAAGLGLAVLHTLHLPPSARVAAALESARSQAPAWCAVVSDSQRAAWQALTPVDAVLRNGVPVASIRVGGGGGAAFIAARYSAEKGVAEGIAAAARAGLAVDVAGLPYDARYEQQVRRRWSGVPGVRLLPAMPRESVWRLAGAASVAICLSQWDEPYGLTAAEAQAAGTPAVVSARGGLLEVVRDGVTGAAVAPRDIAAAARALHACAALDRTACRLHAEAALSLDAAVDAHLDLYARLAR